MKKQITMTDKKNWWEDLRFEFNLYINDNIICQRLFNVKGYNEEVLNSIELKEMMDEITGISLNDAGRMGIIPTFFKNSCKNVTWRDYKPYRPKDVNDDFNIFSNEDFFTFEVKVDKKTVAKSVFSGNHFQTDVRYAVNIREIIPEIISELEDYMSRKKYTLPYSVV